jgi:hypothetical protein
MELFIIALIILVFIIAISIIKGAFSLFISVTKPIVFISIVIIGLILLTKL